MNRALRRPENTCPYPCPDVSFKDLLKHYLEVFPALQRFSLSLSSSSSASLCAAAGSSKRGSPGLVLLRRCEGAMASPAPKRGSISTMLSASRPASRAALQMGGGEVTPNIPPQKRGSQNRNQEINLRVGSSPVCSGPRINAKPNLPAPRDNK